VKDKPIKLLTSVEAAATCQDSSKRSASSSEQSSEEQEGDGSHEESRTRWYRNSNQPLPPGFKELCSRVEKFSGKTGDCDFKLWLEDFEVVSKDCGWSDKQQTQWFSWFITGPAKTTWQQTLKTAEKASWKAIKKVYQGQI